MNTNKLQFLHHSSPFQTVEEAKGYVLNLIEDGSLKIAIGEPFVLVYGQTDDLNALIGIGTKEDGTGVFFIDQDADVASIKRIKAILANVVASCGFDEDGKLTPFSSELVSGSGNIEDAIEELASFAKAHTLNVSSTRTVDLTLANVSGESELTADVKVPRNITLGNNIFPNTLQVGDNGLYVYIDIAHTLGTNKFKMTINDQIKEIDLEDTVKNGVYDSASRSIVLTLNNSNKVYIDLQDIFNEFKASNIVCWLPNNEKTNLQSVVSSGGVISDFESGNETNIIRSVGGLFASVNLTYNALTNTLRFVKSDKDEGSKVTEIQLNSATILDHIYYDRSKEELVLIYHTTDGQRQEVRIPISDLFEEWYTDNSNSTVTLTKSRSVSGYTSLKGNVNVAPLSLVPHNILQEFHNAGFHGLSVNGVAENIAYGDETVKDALDNLGADLADEVAARQSGDDALSGAIDAEASARTSADTELRNAISAETSARQSGDHALSDAIGAEASARTSADTELRNAISAETSARQSGDHALSDAIDAEANARANADHALSDAIDAEANARENADHALSDAIDAEANARTNADHALSDAIGAEASARTSADTELRNAISAETSARISADNALSGAVQNEASARASADNALSGAIDTEVNTRISADNDLRNAISGETSARISADNALSAAVQNEASARASADNELRNAISGEAETRERIDTEISGLVNNAFEEIGSLQETINTSYLNVSGGNAIDVRVSGDTGNPLSKTLYIQNKIYPSANNIIQLRDDSLYAKVEMEYNGATNTLTFDNGINGQDVFHLLGVSIINDITYDPSTDSLVIEYEINTPSGTTPQTVDVPVSDFFKPLIPNNVNHTATVTTGTTSGGNQTIGVDVNVDRSSNNILQVTTGNTLFVDGSGIQTISGKVDNLEAQVDILSGVTEELAEGIVTFQNSDTVTFNVGSDNVVTAEIGDENRVVDCGDYYV